ncbi:MAG: hypothetical protein IKP74_05070 [Clostridia bacterium]|nr:hypothetical protein [Clostridia bacterium]
MVLQPKETHIAYRCPACLSAVKGLIGDFIPASGMLRLKCPCGKSRMQVTVSPDREKFRFDVPCLFCRQDHHFSVSRSVVLGGRLFLLNCPYTNVDIGFLGPDGELDSALENQLTELSKLAGMLGVEKLQDLTPEEAEETGVLPDAQVHDVIRFIVKEMEADGAITCPCGGGNYETAVTENGILVYCPACGASHLFPANSVSDAEQFLHCESLELTNPRKMPGNEGGQTP